MSRTKVILAIIFFLVVGGLYVYVYRDAFRRQVIHITHTHDRAAMLRERRARGANTPAPADASPKPMFVLGEQYKLTYLRVVRLDELKSKGHAVPLWELTSKSASVPTERFVYGATVPGMQPSVAGLKAEPLSNNVPYRLMVEAGKLKGEHDFTLTDQEYPPAE